MNALLKDIYESISGISERISVGGTNLPALAASPRWPFGVISDDELKILARYLHDYLDIISHVGTNVTDIPRRTSLQVDEFLKRHRLVMADPCFFQNLKRGELIEVYALNHQQLFRNPEYFQICSYDLETLIFIPWDKLFWRHAAISKTIGNILGRVVDEEISRWENVPIPKHTLRECFDGHDRVIHYEMKRVGVVLDEELGAPMGYATVLKANTLDHAQNISIL